MRIYTATIIAIGIMFILFLGGVETTSSKLISGFIGDGLSLWETTTFWLAIAAALAGFLLTNSISAGGFSFQGSSESVIAGLASAIYYLVISDLLSLVSKVGETTCTDGLSVLYCTWEYWVIWAMIVPLAIGYGISIISFVRGSD